MFWMHVGCVNATFANWTCPFSCQRCLSVKLIPPCSPWATAADRSTHSTPRCCAVSESSCAPYPGTPNTTATKTGERHMFARPSAQVFSFSDPYLTILLSQNDTWGSHFLFLIHSVYCCCFFFSDKLWWGKGLSIKTMWTMLCYLLCFMVLCGGVFHEFFVRWWKNCLASSKDIISCEVFVNIFVEFKRRIHLNPS